MSAFVTDAAPLSIQDAVAAIILVDGDRYLLQQRDDKPGIWYPGHWGCFGGAVEPGESPEQALSRELQEELGYHLGRARPAGNYIYDLRDLSRRSAYRRYFAIDLKADDLQRLTLGEGCSMVVFDRETVLSELRLTPYDAFALFLFIERQRLEKA